MLTYEEGGKVPVYGERNGRKVLLRRALAGKTARACWEEGLEETFSLQPDGTWLLTSYSETRD